MNRKEDTVKTNFEKTTSSTQLTSDSRRRISFAVLLGGLVLVAGTSGHPARAAANLATDQAVDGAIAKEHALVESLKGYHPLVETYLQRLEPDRTLGAVPVEDHYFLGKLDLSEGVNSRSLIPEPGMGKRIVSFVKDIFSYRFLPNGFAQMVLVDGKDFDRDHYEFEFVHREFLGEVRTLVYEVRPKTEAGTGRFIGRIWVEDQDDTIVRFNGTYNSSSRDEGYFHFDSWRTNIGPDLWMPSYVYTEESDFGAAAGGPLRFKGQTRIWGYAPKSAEE
jgi:hypothetical protein